MTATITPQRAATAAETHPLSHHPVVQKLLAAGPDKQWRSEDVAELLGLTTRSVALLCEARELGWTHYKVRQSSSKRICRNRRITTHSLLIYVLRNSQEVPVKDMLDAWSACFPRLPLATLEAMNNALGQIIARRKKSGAPVVCVRPDGAPPSAAAAEEQTLLGLF